MYLSRLQAFVLEAGPVLCQKAEENHKPLAISSLDPLGKTLQRHRAA